MPTTITGSLINTNTAQFNTWQSTAGVNVGAVLQVVQTVKTDTFTYSGTAFTDITGLTVTITPRFASSKIMISVSLHAGADQNSYPAYILARGSTSIGAANSVSPGTSSAFAQITTVNNVNDTVHLQNVNFMYLDSPSTVLATTYRLQVSPMRTPAKTWYLNRSALYDDSNKVAATSTITAMEIAQ